MAVSTRDRDIVTKSFRMLTRGIAPSDLLEQMDWDRYFNVFSSATGDNRYLNPVPQFSPATDPRYGRLMQTVEGGMGSMWKDMFEDNVTLLTLTPGVAQFSGLLPFITNMFNPAAAIIANKGRAPSLSYYMGQAAGSIAFAPMQLVSISVQFLSFLMDTPKNSFFTVKPAMGAYTMAATGVLNDLMVKLGYIDPVLPKRLQEQNDPLYGLKPDYDNSHAVSALRMLMPDSVNSDGTIDLMRLIMKGTRKHRKMLKLLSQMDNETILTVDEKFDRAKQLMQEVNFGIDVLAGSPTQDFIDKEMGTVGKVRGETEGMNVEVDSAYTNKAAYEQITTSGQGLADFASTGSTGSASDPSSMQSMGTSGDFGAPAASNPNETARKPTMSEGGGSSVADGQQAYYEDNPDDRSWAGDIADLVQTAIYGGLDGVTFRVETSSGSVTDSFSSSDGPSPMASKFNSIVQAANEFKFDIAAGATGIGIVDGVVNMVKEGAMGVLSGSVIGNIPMALVNNAYAKIPNHWTESTSQLHGESYEMNFNCNYAHPYEQIMKIWIPFALTLPMVAAFSSGGATHTAPFYVRAFCQSRQLIRTGLVSSVRYEFGAGPNGWTKDRKPLNLKIVMDIKDLDPLVSIPIDRSLSILDLTNPARVVSKILTDDTAANNYFSRITGMTYLDTVLRWSRMNRGITGAYLDMKTSIRADNIASKISGSIAADLARIFTQPISR